MDELINDEWVEQARWIKYEEAREEGSERWGQPHVSSLSFHSLINLRYGFTQVYTETLNSRYLKVEKGSQNDIVGCVIPLMKVSLLTEIRKITERQTF